MPRIMKYAEFIKSNAVEKNNDIDDDDLKSLIVLLELLPVSNATKNRQRVKKSIKSKEPQRTKVPTIDTRKSLVEVVPLGTNIEDYIKEKQRIALTSSTTVQPYLIYVSGEAKKYFIVVDQIILNRTNQSNAIAAFDLLFKIYYVLNVEYPISLQNFYNFIDAYIFQITERKAVGVVTSLHINLKNIILDNTPLNIDESDDDSE